MSNTFKNFRNNFIDLSEIFGIDLVKGIIDPHEDFANCKETIREEVIESLSSAKQPSDLAPIELYMDDEGRIHIVDGYHRVENALINYKSDPKTWGKIKYEVFRGTKEDAQFKAVASNLGDGRSPLTPAEEFKAIAKWIHAGYSIDEIVQKLGRNNSRWIGKVSDIISQGVFAIEEAVRENKIDLTTAVQIARKVDVKDQKEVLEAAIAESKNVTSKSGQSAVRSSLGIAQRSRKVRPHAEIKDYILSFWDADTGKEWEDGKLDDNIDGQFTAITYALGLDHLPLADVIEIFDGWFWKEKEKDDAVIEKQQKGEKPVGKGKGKKFAAPWQVGGK